MIVNQLTSSSAGNCTIISNSSTAVMIDAGISLKKVLSLCADIKLDALFITHEHADHIKSAGTIARKFKIPVYIPELSYLEKKELFTDCEIHFIEGGAETIIKDLSVTAFSTKHDSVASVGFIITDLLTGKKYGHLTDTGTITPLIKLAMENCDAYFIESDYDEEVLDKNEHYSDILKIRIRSPLGHLSNTQSLTFIRDCINFASTQFLIIGHLSKKNNSPEILREAINKKFTQEESDKFFISYDQLIKEII